MEFYHPFNFITFSDKIDEIMIHLALFSFFGSFFSNVLKVNGVDLTNRKTNYPLDCIV